MSTVRGHHAISAVGGAVLLGAVLYHWNEVEIVGGAIGPVLALVLDGGIAFGVMYAGRRLGGMGFSPSEEWRIAGWTLAGGAVAAGAFGATLAVRALEGRPLVEPAFPTLVAVASGCLAGTVAGYYAVRQAAEAQRSRDAVRAVSFVNHLLRHDLRNDLTAIRGYAELLQETDDGGASDHAAVVARKADEGLDRIETTSALADALLDDTEFDRVDLAETARHVVAGFRDRPEVTVETDIDDTAPVTANEGLRSVVDNLVENAIEHAGPGVTVRVTVRDDGETVTLTVDDDGPGLPPERSDRPFRTDSDGETGGLALVGTLVREYGGSVSAGDADLGGARIEVTLPRAES